MKLQRATIGRRRLKLFMHLVHTKPRFPDGSFALCRFGYFRLQFVGL